MFVLVSRPKSDSLIVVPDAVIGLISGVDIPRTAMFDFMDFLTAAKTTLAKDIPEADPRYRESEVPRTATWLAFVTSLSIPSWSAIAFAGGPVVSAPAVTGESLSSPSLVGLEMIVLSATLNGTPFSLSRSSKYSMRDSK
jgi:hypothetical protein